MSRTVLENGKIRVTVWMFLLMPVVAAVHKVVRYSFPDLRATITENRDKSLDVGEDEKLERNPEEIS